MAVLQLLHHHCVQLPRIPGLQTEGIESYISMVVAIARESRPVMGGTSGVDQANPRALPHLGGPTEGQ